MVEQVLLPSGTASSPSLPTGSYFRLHWPWTLHSAPELYVAGLPTFMNTFGYSPVPTSSAAQDEAAFRAQDVALKGAVGASNNPPLSPIPAVDAAPALTASLPDFDEKQCVVSLYLPSCALELTSFCSGPRRLRLESVFPRFNRQNYCLSLVWRRSTD